MELGQSLSGAAQYLKVPGTIEQMFTGEEPQPKHWAEELEEQICSFCPACDYQTRIGGCLFMFTLGFFISLGSTFRLFQLIQGNPTPFCSNVHCRQPREPECHLFSVRPMGPIEENVRTHALVGHSRVLRLYVQHTLLGLLPILCAITGHANRNERGAAVRGSLLVHHQLHPLRTGKLRCPVWEKYHAASASYP